MQDYEVVDAVIRSVPAPVPVSIDGRISRPAGVSALLGLDGQYQLYTFDCPDGRCTGFAVDLWRALPDDQQQGYADAVMDALIASFPDVYNYTVTIDGRYTGTVDDRPYSRYIATRVDWNSGWEDRQYRFFPSR